VFHDFKYPIQVFGYDAINHGEQTPCTFVSAAMTYDNPMTGEETVVMLIVHQAILIPRMKKNLLAPTQL
jgi:hypothetical protein